MPSNLADFDFFLGRWQVSHRRLVGRLLGSTEWQEFDGTCVVHPTLGGLGNVDDNVVNLPGETYRAVTIRAFDPVTQSWSIWWLDGRHPHQLDVPVVGGFKDGTGTFLAVDKLGDQPILVRFRWFLADTGQPMWEQAFSPDDGTTWGVNWTMAFTPVA